jgi:hypothetical protein
MRLSFINARLWLEGGGSADAAFTLSWAFEEDSSSQQELRTFFDPVRKQAYAKLSHALNNVSVDYHNSFYRFPRLNEVLPLPPAKNFPDHSTLLHIGTRLKLQRGVPHAACP